MALDSLEKVSRKIYIYINELNSKNIEFTNLNYLDVLNTDFNQNDFVYCDPPYLITNANYNKYWNNDEEMRFLAKLDELNNKGIKFALSNVIEHKGRINEILLDWCIKYNVHDMNHNYSNGFVHVKNGNNKKETLEVLIVNY